ncbi:MAG TPA: hypothetical protein VGB17_10955 [Pyrinomonadaceae bacterium]
MFQIAAGRASSSSFVNAQGNTYKILAGLLRCALLAALVWSGWSIYRDLPNDEPAPAINQEQSAQQTELLIVLRRPPDETGATALDIPVELVQADLSSVWSEYLSERRPGIRFEDFLARRLKGRPLVRLRLDKRGQANVKVNSGRWLVRAQLSGAENIEWRLPFNISGRSQTLELTPENAYARTKTF